MIKLLLLEDDTLLSQTLQLFLQRAGYLVDVAYTQQEAEEYSFQNRYDLYLFDINLPQGSGLELLAQLRQGEDMTPTIFITAQTDMHTMEQGFSLDAIDYIKKPFEPQELLLRLQAKFRSKILYHDSISYDPQSDILRQNGEVIDLGHVQHQIFTMLLLHRGELVSKEALYECFDKSSSRALRVAITAIKQKLGIEIKNIRAKGYLLESL